ncbi:MAG: FAD-binding oxidoreductase, partial [Sedimenticola sp.]
MDSSEFILALSSILPDSSVIKDEEALRPYECDGMPAYRQMPLVAVLPETVQQVQEVMRLCHRER